MIVPLMISVAGVRGIVGESLTPPVLARFAAAFAAELPPGEIVVGRDARRSGPMAYRAVAAGLTAAGRHVADLGLATTPATQLAVETLKAAGGIILTASHNPAQWNALKFLSGRGEFIDADLGAQVRARFDADRDLWRSFDQLGAERAETRADDWHIARVLGLEDVNLAAIRARKLNVVVDGCASVGGVTAPRLLRQLNATVVELDCVPNGIFTRELEPLPEHLGHLGRAVREAGADFGVALDPDADRAAFVDAAGVALGEEFTVALATATVLERRTGPVVTNLSTSRMMDAVCARAHVPLHRTLVGEAHVVAAMREHRAVVGGEGNGGVILPAAHYGRDGLVAIALVAQAMRSGESLRALADRLPRLVMRKHKASRSEEPWERAASRLRAAFPGFAIESVDGLRFSQGDDWVHVRPAVALAEWPYAEPVVRVIAESPSDARTGELVAIASRALAGTS